MQDIMKTAAPTSPTIGMSGVFCCPRRRNSRNPRMRNGADTANHSSAHCAGRIPSVMCIANTGTAESTSNDVKKKITVMERSLLLIPASCKLVLFDTSYSWAEDAQMLSAGPAASFCSQPNVGPRITQSQSAGLGGVLQL